MDNQHQVDLILLDFSKHSTQFLISASWPKFYIVELIDIYRWISLWLTQRLQHVILDGITSDLIPVLSGVPQSTVLGPLMFLIYINNITNNLCTCLLMTVYCIELSIQRMIPTCFKTDLNTLSDWSTIWQMKVNSKKCILIRCTKSHSPNHWNCTLENYN